MNLGRNDIFIVDAKRSAMGAFNGTLSSVPAVHVAATVANNLLHSCGIDHKQIDEVIFGNVLQAGAGQNPARQVLISMGIPTHVPAYTVNKVCASSMKAVALAAQSIALGEHDLVLAGGLENMSSAPYLLSKARFGYRMGNAELIDSMINDGLWDVFNNYHMGITAENLVEKYSLTREELDCYACESHAKAAAAQQKGLFRDEIVPIEIQQKKNTIVFDTDECIRPDTTIDVLKRLRPAFTKSGLVTAGNASAISDGAAVMLLASEKACSKYSLQPLARIIGTASAGVDPAEMGLGVVASTRKLCQRYSLALEKIDVFEINEAFAAVSLAAEKELALDRSKTNVNGGAIALGHPIGTSGARIVVTLCHEMKRRSAPCGLASLCVGGGMGMAMAVQLV